MKKEKRKKKERKKERKELFLALWFASFFDFFSPKMLAVIDSPREICIRPWRGAGIL